MKIKRYMKKSVITIQASQIVSDAIALFIKHPIGMLPVVDEKNRLVGILSIQDILHLIMPVSFDLVTDLDFLHDLGAAEHNLLTPEEIQQPVKNLMSEPYFAETDFTLFHAAAIMSKHGMHDLPVVDHDGKLVGLLSHVDVGRGLITRWHTDTPRRIGKE